MAVPWSADEYGGDEYGEEWMEAVGAVEVKVREDLRAVLSAAEYGDAGALSRALDNLSGSVDSYGEDWETALHLACTYGHLSCAQLLLAAGASVNIFDQDGGLPLHYAAAGGYADIVQMLLRATKSQEQLKSVVQAGDSDGDTPLHLAARGSHADVVRHLLSYGAVPNLKNKSGERPADLAEDDEVRQLLLVAEDKIAPGSVADELINLKRRKLCK